MEELVSIIVPIYNVEKYLGQCIESIVNQTYKNLQIILINDGSTDRSYNICLEYAKKDKRIDFINKNNSGSANSRNIGLSLVKGKYVAFVDSDDYVELNMIEYMVESIKKYNVDIVQCGFKEEYINGYKESVDSFTNDIISNENFLKEFLTNWRCCLLWNKLFSVDVIESVTFKEGHYIDDEFFTYKCVVNSKKVFISDKVLYYYRMRKSSITKSIESQKQLNKDKVDFLVERYNIISKNFKNIDNLYFEHFLTYILIISKDYYIDENLIMYIKNNLKKFIAKILTRNINLSIKISIIKLLITKPSKILKLKNSKLEHKNIDLYYD